MVRSAMKARYRHLKRKIFRRTVRRAYCRYIIRLQEEAFPAHTEWRGIPITNGRCPMPNARDVAKYFLLKNDEEAEDLISNLKLQKLVYYAQGFHLAMFDEPLFSETLQAWTHGPVVPDLYHEYKSFGPGFIPTPDDFDPSSIPKKTREFLDEVYDVFGQYSALKLRSMTHDETPWQSTPNGDDIPIESLRDYFKTRLTDGEE